MLLKKKIFYQLVAWFYRKRIFLNLSVTCQPNISALNYGVQFDFEMGYDRIGGIWSTKESRGEG